MPTWVGTSAAPQFGTTSATPTWPTGYTPTAGDMAVMHVSSRHPIATTVPNTPTGWVLQETRVGGGGTFGADVGPSRITVFTKELVGGETLAAVTWASGTGRTIGASVTVFSKAVGSTWDLGSTSGEDTTAGIAFSITGAADPGFAAGDAVLLAYCLRSDSPDLTARAITATGATFATATERVDLGTTQGNDHRHAVATTVVSTGTATAAPVVTATLSTSHTGVAAAVRIREVSSPDATVTPAVIAATTDVVRPAVNIAELVAAIAATVAAPQPSVSVGAGPSAIPAVAALPNGSQNVAAGPAVLPVVIALPQVAAGVHTTSQPATVAALVALPQTTRSIVAGPTVLAAVVALVRPAVNVRAGPAVASLIVVLPQAAPVIEGDGVGQPASVAVVAALVRPLVNTTAGPAVMVVPVAVPQAGAAAGAGPAAIALIMAVPQATPQIGGVTTLGAMTVITAVAPQPIMSTTGPAQTAMAEKPAEAASMTGTGE